MAPKQAAKQAPAKEAAPAAKPKEQPKAAKPEGKQVAKPEGKQAAKPEGKQQQAAKPQGKQQQQPAKPQGKQAEPAKKPAEKAQEKPKQKAKAKSEISGVYIRGLNLEGMNRDSIVKLFNCGQPSEVRIRRRGRNGVEGAYVLLFFRTPGATKKALEFNGKVVKGNKLSVVQAKAKPTPERKTYCTSVWVGGVPGGSNAQQLTTLFRKAGKVLRVRVYNPRKTAYVYYATTAAAAKAVKMFNNLSLRGEHLRVKLSIRSKERDAQKAIKAGFTVGPRALARIGKGGKPAPKAKGKGAKAAAAPAPKAAAKAAAPAPAAKGGKQAPAAPAPAAKGGKGQAQAAPAAAPAPAAKGGKGQAQAAAPAPAPAPKGGKGQQAQAAPAAKAPQAAPAAKAQAAPAPAPKGGKGQQQQKAAAPAPAAKGGKGKGK